MRHYSKGISVPYNIAHHSNSLFVGVWSREEEACLEEVLKRHGVDWVSGDGSIPVNVTWDLIANEVKTRTADQCRNKWYS